MSVTRFGVSLEGELLTALDDFVLDNQFASRSQAIRHLIEKNLVEQKWKCDNIVAGAITIVYQQLRNDIRTRSAEIQLKYRDVVLSSQFFHLTESNCLEIVAVKGPSHRLTELSDKLIAIKGMQHGKLVMSKAD
jgi:CopG family transcriptional regulator, nickel-responsive regulator